MDPGQFLGGWDRSPLADNVRIGRDAYLEAQHSFDRFRSQRDPGLVIGDAVHIYTWTTFNVEPGGYVEIGDRSVIVGAVFMCVERIVVGADVLISHQVTIADSDFHPTDPVLRRRDAIANAPGADGSDRPRIEARPVTIENGVEIGIGALILKGVRIGRNARVGPGAVITRDVPAGTRWEGNPARMVDAGR